MIVKSKGVIALVAGVGVLYGMLSLGWAKQPPGELTSTGETLSAHLTGVPLKDIVTSLKKDTGIWFQADEVLFDERVTIQFTELSFEAALRRILAPFNYSLVFTKEGTPAGVIITGKKESAPEQPQIAPGRAVHPPPTQPELRDAPSLVSDIPPPGDPLTATETLPEELKVIGPVPPPGGNAELSTEEREQLTIIKDCAPPEDASVPVAEDLEGLEPVNNCPPPEM